jgi:ferritin
MPLSAAVARALNDQIRKEFDAAHLYLAMSAWLADRNLDGMARWMRFQSEEERGHALKLFDWVLDRGGTVRLAAVAEPVARWKTPLDVFVAAQRHEQAVSKSVHELYVRAGAEKDYATQTMLQWFLTEQVEEEKASTAVVERLRLAGDSAAGLLLIDREMGQRTSAD